MLKRGFSFELEVPNDWIQFMKNAQLILQGPHDEEIIVSGWVVRGESPETDVLTLRERIFQNALESVNSVVSDPSVEVLEPHHIVQGPGSFEQWSLSAKTIDDSIVFEASIFKSLNGVLLITFESPNLSELKKTYFQLLNSVSPLQTKQLLDYFV